MKRELITAVVPLFGYTGIASNTVNVPKIQDPKYNTTANSCGPLLKNQHKISKK